MLGHRDGAMAVTVAGLGEREVEERIEGSRSGVSTRRDGEENAEPEGTASTVRGYSGKKRDGRCQPGPVVAHDHVNGWHERSE
jgi:hypothetical protein